MKGPIGVFDSGLGGLTVAKEIWRSMPDMAVVYLGDTAHLPYGTKSPKRICFLSIKNVKFLVQKKVKMVIVACNTASALALPTLKKKFSLPLLGVIVPGAKAAVKATHNRKIGVIGTPATIKSYAYEKQIRKFCPDARIYSKACPLFVSLVEEGWVDSDITKRVAEQYLGSLKDKGVDTLVLGCTHYPLLKGLISKVMGKKVALIDSAEETAREVKAFFSIPGTDLSERNSSKTNHFFVTDGPESFYRLGRRFLGRKVDKVTQVVI